MPPVNPLYGSVITSAIDFLWFFLFPFIHFDEVIVTTFTAGQQSTLPIWIFSQLVRPRDRPVTNVVATIVILITFLPIFFAQKISAESSDIEGGSK